MTLSDVFRDYVLYNVINQFVSFRVRSLLSVTERSEERCKRCKRFERTTKIGPIQISKVRHYYINRESAHTISKRGVGAVLGAVRVGERDALPNLDLGSVRVGDEAIKRDHCKTASRNRTYTHECAGGRRSR